MVSAEEELRLQREAAAKARAELRGETFITEERKAAARAAIELGSTHPYYQYILSKEEEPVVTTTVQPIVIPKVTDTDSYVYQRGTYVPPAGQQIVGIEKGRVVLGPTVTPSTVDDMREATVKEAVELAQRMPPGVSIPAAGRIMVKEEKIPVLKEEITTKAFVFESPAETARREAQVEAREMWEEGTKEEREAMGKSAAWGERGYEVWTRKAMGVSFKDIAIESTAKLIAAKKTDRLAQHQLGALATGPFGLVLTAVGFQAIGVGVGLAQKAAVKVPSFMKGRAFQRGLQVAGAALYAPRVLDIRKTYIAGEKPKALAMIVKDVATLGVGTYFFKRGYLKYAPYPGKELGLERGETLEQLKYQKVEAYAAGELEMKFGKTHYRGIGQAEKVFDVYQQEIGISGITKDIKGIEGAKISMYGLQPLKVGEELAYGIGYDISVPTDVKGVTKTMGFWEIYKPKTVVTVPPATRFYGGYGVIPRMDVTYEQVTGLTLGKEFALGDPVVIKEWLVSGKDWRDPGTEMMKMLAKSDVTGLGITTEGFAPYKGDAAFELTTEIIGTGGGGLRQLPRFRAPPSIGGAPALWAIDAAKWSGMDLATGLTAVGAGRAGVAALYKPAPVKELWAADRGVGIEMLKGLEREGYLVKRPKVERVSKVGLDVGMEAAMRSAARQASRLRSKQEVGLEQQLGLESTLKMGQKQSQMQRQAMRTAQKQMMQMQQQVGTPTTTRIKMGIQPPTGAWSLFPKEARRRKKKREYRMPRIHRRLRYTPTILGMEYARRDPSLRLPRAPRDVGVGAVGIRMPTIGGFFKPKKKKRVDKRRKRRYEKDFMMKLGL